MKSKTVERLMNNMPQHIADEVDVYADKIVSKIKIMTPKEKAEELVDKYYVTIVSFLNDRMKDMNAKQCALIAVDEIIKVLDSICEDRGYDPFEAPIGYLEEWQEIKQQIEKL